MTKIMTLQEYTTAWKRANPHDNVQAPKAVKTQWGILIPYFIGLLAANLLSAAHTGPMLASTFGKLDPTLGIPLGIIGVLATEFTAFILMLIPFSDNKRENILRVAVICLAIGVSLIANINATFNSLQASDTAGQIAAGLVGMFAPLANIAMAEVLRLFRERAKKEREGAEGDYKQKLIEWDVNNRKRYAAYLGRYGIKDATEIMKLSNGEQVEHEVSPQSTTEPVMGQKTSKTVSVPPRIVELATKLQQSGDIQLSYSAIQSKYGVGPSDVSKAKRYLGS